MTLTELQPFLAKNEIGYYLCPLPDCGLPLYLEWSHSIPLVDEHYNPNDMASAVSDSWEVVCENGHHLANSVDGNDSARPFDLAAYVRTGTVPDPSDPEEEP